jgi:hypothetical protein
MRLLDYACHSCKVIVQDVFDDEPAPRCECCKDAMVRVLISPPSVDARSPFRVLSLGGPSFTSYRQMESYAKQTGQTVLPKEEQARMRQTTTEERLRRNMPQKIEAFKKAKYRLAHGYRDHPKLPTEKELKTS